MVENVIDNPIELLIFFLIVLATMKILFALANWLEGRPVKEKKKKEKKSSKFESVKEEKIEVVKTGRKGDASIEVKKDLINPSNGNYSNYLYDRFVDAPSIEDNVSNNKNFDGFLTDDEASDIRNRDIKIKVNDVEDISTDYKKNKLYKKIEQMASENIEAKEKMLQEFEELPKSMKLLLIENIMQKM